MGLPVRSMRPSVKVEGSPAPESVPCPVTVRSERVVVIVRRLSRRLEQLGGWREESIVLPEGTWEHVLRTGTVEGGSRPLAEVVGDDAVVVLARVCSPDSQTDSDHAAHEQEAAR